MKTGSQSGVFDYTTGSVNTTEAIKPTTRMEKPAFAAVAIDLMNETFEQRLIRLGKIRPNRDRTDTDTHSR